MRTEPTTLQEFAESIREEIAARLSDRYPEIWPEIQTVEKIQGASYLGVRIDRGNGVPAPVINVEKYFLELEGGMSFQNVMEQMIRNTEEILQNDPAIPVDRLRDYGDTKDKLIMQVIPIKGNEERLAEMPHREMEDMAVVCRALLGANRHGEMSFLVTNSILQEYGVSQEQLFADAAHNMSQNIQYSIRPLFSVLSEMNPVFADEPVPEPDNTLFVCTNEMSMFGAGAVAHPEFMEEAGKELQGSFFVLPSSIHEVLLLKDDGKTDYHALEAMVKEINVTQVMPHERLTDTVYHVDPLERVFETAKHFHERQMEKDKGRGSVLKDLADSRQKSHEQPVHPRSAPERGGAAR